MRTPDEIIEPQRDRLWSWQINMVCRFITVAQSEAFAAGRAAGIEEAARVALEKGLSYQPLSVERFLAPEIASAIRALIPAEAAANAKTTPPTEVEGA